MKSFFELYASKKAAPDAILKQIFKERENFLKIFRPAEPKSGVFVRALNSFKSRTYRGLHPF
jgi:hypothetical protein